MRRKIYWEEFDKVLPKIENITDLEESESDLIVDKIIKTSINLEIENMKNRYNISIGHTNFILTEDMLESVAMISGVEALHDITPYRMRIITGKLFDKYEVLNTVETVLGVTCSNNYYIYDDVVIKHVNDFISHAEDKKWVLYIAPSGEISSITSFIDNDTTKVEAKYKQLDEVQEGVGGTLLTNL